MAEWSRAIAWARISDGDREGTGLEHLLRREGIADSVGRALSALDGCLDIVLDYEGLFRRVA